MARKTQDDCNYKFWETNVYERQKKILKINNYWKTPCIYFTFSNIPRIVCMASTYWKSWKKYKCKDNIKLKVNLYWKSLIIYSVWALCWFSTHQSLHFNLTPMICYLTQCKSSWSFIWLQPSVPEKSFISFRSWNDIYRFLGCSLSFPLRKITLSWLPVSLLFSPELCPKSSLSMGSSKAASSNYRAWV